MHDSLTPLGGLVPLFNLLAGCIWPGGVGAGLYGFLVVAIIAVFIAGLMVGRTPEYLGKKIESREMKLAMFAVLIYPLSVLGFSAASVLLQTALDSLNNAGPHGLSEIIYAFASANANNGSAFAGLNGNTPWFNTTLGIVMLLGRFAYVDPGAGARGRAGRQEEGAGFGGHLPDHRAAVRRPADRRRRHPLPAAIFPGARAGAGRRAFPDARRQGVLTAGLIRLELSMSTKAKAQGLFDPAIIRSGGARRAAQARSARAGAQPGDFRHRGGLGSSSPASSSATSSRRRLRRCSPARSRSGCGSRCCSPISPRRWRRDAARRRPRALRRSRSDTRAKRYVDPKNLRGAYEAVNALDLRVGDVVLVEAGDIIPGDGDIVEGLASVNEFGDHRRIRAGHPRSGRRPLGGDRRHDGALRLDQGAHHRRGRARPSSTA